MSYLQYTITLKATRLQTVSTLRQVLKKFRLPLSYQNLFDQFPVHFELSRKFEVLLLLFSCECIAIIMNGIWINSKYLLLRHQSVIGARV